jgi:hypothetical protein
MSMEIISLHWGTAFGLHEISKLLSIYGHTCGLARPMLL